MKIVFLNRYQNKVERGAEVFISELTKRLSKNHQVDIFSGEKADSLKAVLEGNYDYVIPVNGRMQSLKFSLARILGKYKLLITGHSGIGKDDIWNIAVAKPDIFVALTDHMAKWAKTWAWGSRIIKISNGIDLDKFSHLGEKIKIDLPRPIILSAGALVWYKHHERVIKAVKVLGYGSVLIVGQGTEKEKLEKLGKNLLNKNFKIISADYKNMPKVYKVADLFTLPSWDREAFGIVYLEAMASGLPIIAPDDQSRREIIGDAGIFTDVSDSQKYAKALKLCLENKWQNKPRQQAEKFSWDKIAKEYESVMISLLEKDG